MDFVVAFIIMFVVSLNVEVVIVVDVVMAVLDVVVDIVAVVEADVICCVTVGLLFRLASEEEFFVNFSSKYGYEYLKML